MKNIIRKRNFSSVKLKDIFVILNEDTGNYHVINESSNKILELIENQISYTELLQKFKSYYEIDNERAKQDLDVFLQKARKLKLVEIN